ncbi:MAG: hypothetical protein ACXWRU_10805 [Pseudobdellovibrionaceae bacterium]
MQTIQTKLLLVNFRIAFIGFFICFLSATPTFANSIVETEFAMSLPRSFQQSLIEQEWQSLQEENFKMGWALPDQVYNTPDVNVLLTGLQLNLNTKLQKPHLGQEGDSLLLESQGLEADLNIQAVAVDQYIEREIGGVIGRFRIQARCEGVQLRMKAGKGAFTMKLSPVFEGSLLRAQVDDLSLSWTTDAWNVENLKCTGAQGFDEVVKEEILKRTKDSSLVEQQKSALIEYVQRSVNQHTLDLSKPRDLTSTRSDIKLSMRINDFTGAEKNALARGVFRVEFTKLNNPNNIFLKLSKQNFEDSSSQNAMIRVPEEFIPTMTKQAFAANSWLRRMESSQLPGFSSLMQSRIKQFFAWRELTNFSKSAKFLFDIYSPKNIEVSGKNLKYQVKASLQSQMYAPKNGQYVPFMDFVIPFSSQVQVSLEQGKVFAKFSGVKLNLQERWEPSYVAKYDPFRTFDRNTIGQRIQSSAEGTATSYVLPLIPLTDTLSLQFQRVQKVPQGSDVVFYLK